MRHPSYLIIGAAVAAMAVFGPARWVYADPYVVTSTAPSPATGFTSGGYMFHSGGGILVQLTDGSGNIVSSANGMPVICESGCSGGTGGGGGTVTQGPQGTNTAPWFVSPGTSTFPITGTVAVSTATVGGSVAINGTVTTISALGGTSTVAVAGASQPPLTGTTTVQLNSSPTVIQGAGGTNTAPWFVSPGTSTFPVSGTVTSIPGAGTETVVQAGATQIPLSGTSTVNAVGTVTAIPGAGTGTTLLAVGANTIGNVNINGTVPVSGSFSSSVTGWTPNGTYATPFVGTSATSEIALPAGAVDVVSNVGTSAAYVNFGTSAAITATTSATPVPVGGEIAITAGSYTNMAAITAAGTTTLNVSGGGGLFTGLGGFSASSGGGGGGTVTQGPQGVNTSPWFVSPGTSTFPVSGTVTALPSGTQTVAQSGALVGTSTVIMNAVQTVNQGTVAGTNTAPWFVSPGTSTFPVSGTLTAIPGAGTSTVLVAGTATVFENVVTSTQGTVAAQVLNIQQIGGTAINTGQIACGTVATVLAATRAARQTITIENLGTGTVFIGGVAVTTAGGMLLPPLQGASITLPTTAAIDCIATATSATQGEISFIETF